MKDEINLLPGHLRRSRVRSIYLARARALLRLALGIGAAVVVGQIAVLAAYYSLARGGVSGTAAVTVKRDVQREVGETNRLLQAVARQAEAQVVWSERLSEVLTAARRLTLRELMVEGEARVLTLRGTSAAAADVTAYQQALEGLSWVKRVEAPLANFAVKPDAAFSLTVHNQ